MADRKNIFLIGRRPGDEDQLTEMLAFVWQEHPDLLDAWLEHLGFALDGSVDVDTQFILPSGKRPDISIRTREIQILVESKLGAGLTDTQVRDYLTYLGGLTCQRVLVLLTQKPVSVKPQWLEWATDAEATIIARRWQEMAQDLGGLGAESLGGDFVQLLVREEFVKPPSFSESDWNAWNAGYKVLQRAALSSTSSTRMCGGSTPR